MGIIVEWRSLKLVINEDVSKGNRVIVSINRVLAVDDLRMAQDVARQAVEIVNTSCGMADAQIFKRGYTRLTVPGDGVTCVVVGRRTVAAANCLTNAIVVGGRQDRQPVGRSGTGDGGRGTLAPGYGDFRSDVFGKFDNCSPFDDSRIS